MDRNTGALPLAARGAARPGKYITRLIEIIYSIGYLKAPWNLNNSDAPKMYRKTIRHQDADTSYLTLIAAAAFLALFSFYLRIPEGAELAKLERYSMAVGEALGAQE